MGVKGLPSKAGADRVVEAIVKRVSKLGYEVTVYCDFKNTPKDFQMGSIKLIIVPSIPGKYFRAPSLFIFSALHALFFGKFDLVHLHNAEAGFILPILRLKYKVISTSHGSAYWRTKWGKIAKKIMSMMDKPFISFSNIATCVSINEAKRLESVFQKKVHYIPNGVGAEYAGDIPAANKILKEKNINNEKYFIFVAGRIEPTKGAHLAIKAINNMDTDEKLIMVGDTNHSRNYQKYLLEILSNKIISIDFIDKPETLYGLMKLAFALIFPSTVEAMSMVLLEASMLEVPIICSDIPENKAIFGDLGIYFENDNEESLTKTLHWALDNPQKMTENSKKLKDHVHSNFSWDVIVNSYVHLYEELK